MAVIKTNFFNRNNLEQSKTEASESLKETQHCQKICPKQKLWYCIPQKGNFDLGLFPTVSDCTVPAFRLRTLRLYHVMFCFQSQQYIVQHKIFKNGHVR